MMPEVTIHDNIFVVRDDKFNGGTKGRFLIPHLQDSPYKQFVYPGTAYGAAIVGLGVAARMSEKEVLVFIAKRSPETYTEFMHSALFEGSGWLKFIPVEMGFYPNVKRACEKYCNEHPEAEYVRAGLDVPWAIDAIGKVAEEVTNSYGQFDAVFSVSGSGTLQRGLQAGNLGRKYFAIGTGQKNPNVGTATLIEHYNIQKFEQKSKTLTPFPSVPTYDMKGWKYCLDYKKEHPKEKVLFWNVAATAADRVNRFPLP